MQVNIFLLCSAVWLFWLCSAPGLSLKLKHRQDREIHQRTYSPRRFCDHSSSSQISGAITQKCRPGFYREWTGPKRGRCVPCSCNGLSNECDEHTGNCVNCQFNTAGDHCERCREGYYGNATNRTCRACACPFTWNNFALACLDIGSGVVECLCKRGYSGPTCERCAYGYYGNPMVPGGSCKPCNCKDGTLNVCDPLTGECIRSGESSGGDHCHECDSCAVTLLVDSEEMDNVLVELKQQLQNISRGPGSLSELKNLEANISETKILVGRHSSAVRHLDPKVEQLEADVEAIRDDFSQLIVEKRKTDSDLEKVSQDVNGTTLKAENLLTEAETLLRAVEDLLKHQMEVKPGDSGTLSEKSKAGLTEEAERIVQEMRERRCTAQRDEAVREQEEAHSLLDIIRNDVFDRAALNQTAASLMASDSSLRDAADVLSDADDRVRRTQDVNAGSSSVLLQLEHLQTELEREQTSLPPVTEMTKDVLKNITDTYLMLEETKKDFESDAAQVDGAQVELSKKLNNMFLMKDTVNKAEEHAEELSRAAAGLQQMLHNAANSTGLLGEWATGDDRSITTVIEKAEMAANQSTEAAERAFEDVEEGDLVNRSEGLKDDSTHLWTEANDTQSDLHALSNTVSSHRGRVTKQKEKGQSLRADISSISDDLKKIHRGDTEVLIESAKTAADVSNSTVRNITERLRNISQEVERITLTNTSVNIDDILTDADQALKTLNTSLPVLKDKIAEVEALSGTAPLSANMTENIWRIKDVIEETRNLVKRLSAATTFNGKGHVELHPPRNLEDVQVFTAVDLLLNRHQNKIPKANYRRRRRQDKHKTANSFVFYLGNKNASGDFIGMAIRSNVLICVYKLGGRVHEVETSQITAATKLDFDRVVFHRVYHDAEVNITQNFTSEKPVSLPPKRNLPDKTPFILDLDPDSVVFYVGGYPDVFTPPVELHYPKYKGAMKLSFINDSPVSLFNYKHAVNMDAKQPAVRIPESEGSYYHDGTGYGAVLVNEPHRKKKRWCRFYTKRRETNALLFYAGNEESFFCVFVERGFLVFQAQQDGRESRIRSPEKVSSSDEQFVVQISDTVTVNYRSQIITADHRQTNYTRYYIGGLPAHLRHRHNITAPPLRGCVERLRADHTTFQYNRMIGVVNGCPASLLGLRTATLSSALSADSLFDWGELPLRVSLGFRTTDRHGTLLRGSSQGSASVHDLQLSLADGYVVFKSDNYTTTSDRRCSDGRWHFVSAVRRPTRLDYSIQTLSPPVTPVDPDAPEGNFTSCITNLYIRRPGRSLIPADLSSFSLMGDVGVCGLNQPPRTELLPAAASNRPQKHKPIVTPTGSLCAHRGEYQLTDEHSWVSYTVPQQDLNHRPHFSLDIKTKSSKGLILHVAGTGVVPLLALYVANGKIKMSLGQNRIIQHKQKSNDGNWHRVDVSVEKSAFHLLVDGIRVTDGLLPNSEGAFLDLHNPVYLGSDPTKKTPKEHDLPINSVIGCLRNFKMNDEAVEKPEASHKTLPCFDGLTETGTYFGGGHVVLDTHLTAGSQFVLTFELRPQYLTGLLFHLQSHETSLSVFLMENKVGVDVNGVVSVSVTPGESLCDGKFHTVTVSKQHDAFRLELDSTSEQKAVPFTSTSTITNTLYIGGTTEQNHVPVSSPFVGCIRNVKLDGKSVALGKSSRVVGPVTVDKCPAD